ncbi:hypothetical protein [Paenisporosarcina sp. OV554]|uniref:hypothetical protein n=1 Tax=Paenisporosarcina sp. OV554 TaxID=2135694 RepID=UPI000D39593F|nr:hypothetical protein [Paenisporosarcina sp. OV554]PUB12223.1 hypothetical protein C8K15_11028 [Paenisporosarcina sp. OV554]
MTKINIVTLKETTLQKTPELYSVVAKCIICKGKHIHVAEEGNVVGHCINLPYPTSYDLFIDRENVENLRLAEKYSVDLLNSNCGAE